MKSKAVAPDESLPPREKWRGKFEFVLTCVGQCVGIGNVTRFSYLCYRNGGGAFLIPYLITVVFAGVPMYFLELALGQLLSIGSLGVWKISPAFKGVGYAAVVISAWLNISFIILIAWACFFLLASFTSVLPWSTCNNWWNTNTCLSAYDKSSLPYICTKYNVTVEIPVMPGVNETSLLSNYSEFSCKQVYDGTRFSSPVREYWERYVLQISGGIEEFGTVRWQLALCSLAVWLMCYFAIWKGIKWTEKVIYVTATLPYILLTILLIRGVTLPGAAEGIKFFLVPDFYKLSESRVWIDAVTQVFFSYGLGLGVMIAYGSYNKLGSNTARDAVFICIMNSGTSLFAGFVVFSVVGFMAHEQGLPVSEVAASGPGLAYIAYPYAVIQLPVSPLWSILFFLALLTLGLDSQFGVMEGFFTAVIDEYPHLFRKKREILIAIVSLASFLIGLLCLTNGGMYMFVLLDFYSASGICLLFVVFCECVGVSWAYGVQRFLGDLETMLGFAPSVFWKLAWLITTPAICLGTLLFYVIQFEPVTYLDYQFPGWAHGIGILIALSSILLIPGYMIFKVVSTKGPIIQRCKEIFRPDIVILPPVTNKGQAYESEDKEEEDTFIP